MHCSERRKSVRVHGIRVNRLTMIEGLQSTFWIWPDPDERWVTDVMTYVASSGKSERSGITVVKCANIPAFSNGIPLVKYLLQLSEDCRFLQNDKTSFLSYKDHLLALQLCIARLKQKDEGEFGVAASDVIYCHKKYSDYVQHSDINKLPENVAEAIKAYEDFLKLSNCSDMWQLYKHIQENFKTSRGIFENLLSVSNFLMIGLPQAEILKKALQLLFSDKEVQHIVVEIPLDISIQEESPPETSTVQVTSHSVQLDNITSVNVNSNIEGSATKEYVEDIVLSFLHLVVNCRNELALAKAMMSPVINLSHNAFTELKRLSVEKKMPMCQTVISYVTRIRLGGQGYAPPKDCPLRNYLKGLEQFVNILNKLQTIIEEDPIAESAIKRVITVLKNSLLKCGGHQLKQSSIEEVATNLIGTAIKVLEMQRSKSVEKECKTSTQIGEEALHGLHNLVNYVNCCYPTFEPMAVLGNRTTQRTPLSIPSLLSYFKSPEEELPLNEDIKPLRQRMIGNKEMNSEAESPPLVSYIHSGDSNSTLSKSCVDVQTTPSKVTFENCLEEKENLTFEESNGAEQIKDKKRMQLIAKSRKRSILSDISNAPSAPKKTNKLSLKSQKSVKLSKAKQQIKGQAQITKFFTFGK